jgi:hypothetical protein
MSSWHDLLVTAPKTVSYVWSCVIAFAQQGCHEGAITWHLSACYSFHSCGHSLLFHVHLFFRSYLMYCTRGGPLSILLGSRDRRPLPLLVSIISYTIREYATGKVVLLKVVVQQNRM